jgi:hypothetical protein
MKFALYLIAFVIAALVIPFYPAVASRRALIPTAICPGKLPWMAKVAVRYSA